MARLIRILSLSMAVVMVSGFSLACNTMEGAGKDVENAGDSVKDAARDAKD